ncbi:Clavaminate synthase-like protein [Lachnellula willkommii]|uniref:Clavaminate synthase-like protein n=1 Tax=Lachnellula willkommii TaxID=215461 RepID=A0A559MG89_9HELO|nr:Clavaminate synthase-like protein [Lachnellula willkommii]
MSVFDFFESFSFEGQKDTAELGFPSSFPFPLALQLNDGPKPSLEEIVEAVTAISKSGELFDLVQQHGGALLIRGLPIHTAADYSAVAHAFGLAAHEEIGRPPNRTILAKNVKTANEGPPEMPIWPHNEYGWSTINPAWLTFSGFVTPESGGETPINSSIALAAAIQKQAPDFYEALLKNEVRAETVATSNTGNSVVGAYGQEILPTDDALTRRKKIEREIQKHSSRWEWHDDESLSVTHIVPLIRKHKATGLTTFFGNLTSAYGRSKHHGATEPPFLGDDGGYHPLPTYGDGSPIPTKYLELALSIAETSQVLIKWTPGDLILLDNYAVMHSRRPWTGERKVLAALWDEEGRIGEFEEGKVMWA